MFFYAILQLCSEHYDGMKKRRFVVSKLKQWSKLHICCSRNIPYIFTHMTPKLPHDTQEPRVQQLLFCRLTSATITSLDLCFIIKN